jgi:hypothetical protein
MVDIYARHKSNCVSSDAPDRQKHKSKTHNPPKTYREALEPKNVQQRHRAHFPSAIGPVVVMGVVVVC